MLHSRPASHFEFGVVAHQAQGVGRDVVGAADHVHAFAQDGDAIGDHADCHLDGAQAHQCFGQNGPEGFAAARDVGRGRAEHADELPDRHRQDAQVVADDQHAVALGAEPYGVADGIYRQGQADDQQRQEKTEQPVGHTERVLAAPVFGDEVG